MITIVFGPPGAGKTCLMTHLGVQECFNRERTYLMKQEILHKNSTGFNLSIPLHTLSSNYDIIAHKFGYSPRFSRRINPYRLGFNNNFVETHFNIPYECICITEAQKYLNSRMSMYFPEWQSRWYEQHRHNNLDIFLDTQRPMLIDVNIRELSSFIEIVNLSISNDKYGRIKKLKWKVRLIENSSLFDRYMSSGKKDKDCYIEKEIIADYNVFDCYNSQNCKPKFYEGHMNEDFDIDLSKLTDDSFDGYVKFLQEFDDELPDNYYTKRGKVS